MAIAGQRVTILGAGIAGLAVARALALRGAEVMVLEQSEALREVGAGLQISPNGGAVLRALGLGAGLERIGVAAQAVQLRDGPEDAPVLRLDLGGALYRFVHRADLIALLAEGAREAGVQIRLLQKVTAVDLTPGRPVLTTAQGGQFEVDLLVGADGLHSLVRAALNGAVAPTFTGQVAWRALIPCEPGAPNIAEVFMGPGRHLVSYPLRGGALRNIVAVEERRRWAEEGWSIRDDPMELKLAFEGFAPRPRAWLEAVEDVWLWGLFRHPVAPVWQRGRAVILGDAAHPTLPFLAQGANMALEDAWVLADRLAGAGELSAALAAYQAMRAPRCARIVAAASQNARAYHLSGPVRDIAHLGLRIANRLAPSLALRRFDWLYKSDVTGGASLR